MGTLIGELGLPTLVIQDGGYHVKVLGECALNFLTGLEDR